MAEQIKLSEQQLRKVISSTIREQLEPEKKTGLVITVPKTIKWEDYQKEIDAVADGSQEMNFKVPTLPKRVKPGDRCYLCYNGYIVGWMTISSMGPKKFDCTTTGTAWEGNFVSRSGEFHKLDQPIPCKGFQGYKYIDYI
jgi:hypothetical protein